MRRFRLRARFLFVLIVLLLAVFLAITLVIVRENTHTLRTSLVDQSKSFAALATQPIGDAYVTYSTSGTIRIKQEIDGFTALDADISQVEIIDTTGHRLFTDTDAPQIPVSTAAASAVTRTYLYDGRGTVVGIVEPYLEGFAIHRYNVVYGISYHRVDRDIQKIVTLVISLSTAILLVSLFVWYVLINRLFLRPVSRISQDALAISKGDLNRKMRLGRNDEIGDLAAAVDTMASSLKADITKLQEVDRLKSEFLMITSHNLRTPLTIIQGYLEELKRAEPAQDVQEMVEPIATNVLRLQGFAEDVLTISTIETGQEDERREIQAIGPILERVASDFGTLCVQKKLQFTAAVATSAWVSLDKSHFHSAIWNLLDNAYKFTAEGGSIGLNVTTTDDKVQISVTDTGIGISAAEIPKLFTKFHRGTDTLTYDYEGTGIGLYISKLIVEQHGGGISVNSAEGKGSTFTIWLPTAEAPKPKT